MTATQEERKQSRKDLVVGLTGLGLALLWLFAVAFISWSLVGEPAAAGGAH
ncbi:MAG TPA: hypothetical protein VFX98_18660 [Longimicrobiaceae bacterium]|nr:hypothetical protein [Longimicrobiaceae bacterium]